jgi:hypothetical protein
MKSFHALDSHAQIQPLLPLRLQNFRGLFLIDSDNPCAEQEQAVEEHFPYSGLYDANGYLLQSISQDGFFTEYQYDARPQFDEEEPL